MSTAQLVSMGFASPPAYPQMELCARQARALALEGVAHERFMRIASTSAIETRCVAAEIAAILDASTSDRMRMFAPIARTIALSAAQEALARANVDPARVTDLVIATCTGFAAPGLHCDLVEQLGLAPSTRPLQLGFMGCFGGVAALRTARALASSDPDAVVLVIAVELCSLHFRRSGAHDALISFSLFGDGASCAIVMGSDATATNTPCMGMLEFPRTQLLGGRDLMSWSIEDDGFAMTLGRAVPTEIEQATPHLQGLASADAVAVHPGGVAILDAVERALAFSSSSRHSRPFRRDTTDAGDLADAREVLRTTGNTSSGAIFRVANRILCRNLEARRTEPTRARDVLLVNTNSREQTAYRESVQGQHVQGQRLRSDLTPDGQLARQLDLLAFGPGLTADLVRIRMQ